MAFEKTACNGKNRAVVLSYEKALSIIRSHTRRDVESTESVEQSTERRALKAPDVKAALDLLDKRTNESVLKGIELLVGLKCVRSALQIRYDSCVGNGIFRKDVFETELEPPTEEEMKEAASKGIVELLKEGYVKSAAWAASAFGLTEPELINVLDKARIPGDVQLRDR